MDWLICIPVQVSLIKETRTPRAVVLLQLILGAGHYQVLPLSPNCLFLFSFSIFSCHFLNLFRRID